MWDLTPISTFIIYPFNVVIHPPNVGLAKVALIPFVRIHEKH